MSVILHNPKERERFFKFAVVGVIGAVVDFGIFNFLTALTPTPAVLASVISFIAAVFSNFTWNRYWTYPDSRSRRISVQLMEFAFISLMGLTIRTPLFAILEKPLSRMFSAFHLPILSSLNPNFLGHNLALAIAVIVVMFWNFFVNRYWTYRDVKS